MIQAARSRAGAYEQVSFVVTDAQTQRIAPNDRPVDAMFSRFGVMFFSDPLAAFVNLAANVRPGGRLAFVCWQREEANEWISLTADIVRGFTPEPVLPLPDAPGPFAFQNRDRVLGLLTVAGWTSVWIDPFTAPTVMGGGQGLEAAVTQAMSTHVGQILRSQVDDATFAAAAAAVRREFSERLVDGAVTFEGNVWVVTAQR